MDTITLFCVFIGENIGKLLILLLRWRGKEKKNSSTLWNQRNSFPPGCRKATQKDFCRRTLSLWLSFNLFSRVYIVHGWGEKSCIWHSTGGQVICGGEVWSVGRGKRVLMMSKFAIPTPPALRIALQPQLSVFLLFYPFPPSFSLMELSWVLLYVKEKKRHRPFKYLFVNPSKNTSNGDKRS